MIKFNELNSLNVRIAENIQKIEIFKLKSDKNKNIMINHLKGENFRLKVILSKIKEKEVK